MIDKDKLFPGQVIWYNDISFTSSSSKRKTGTPPSQFVIVRADVRSYSIYIKVYPISDPDYTTTLYLTKDNIDKYVHSTYLESAISYNAKIDEHITWLHNYLPDFVRGYICDIFRRGYGGTGGDLTGLNEDAQPISISTLLEKEAGSMEKPLGYYLDTRSYYGIKGPDTILKVVDFEKPSATVDVYKFKISWYGTEYVRGDEYGTSTTNSIFSSTKDMYVWYEREYPMFEKSLENQIEKRVAKVEKLKVLI